VREGSSAGCGAEDPGFMQASLLSELPFSVFYILGTHLLHMRRTQ